MQLSGASFLVTFRCPSRCEHCAYNAGPERKGYINLNDAEKWLHALTEFQQFEWLTLHGGEPFLYLEEMKGILGIALELEIPRRGAITNGFWARTSSQAKRTLNELVNAGLTNITFSVDGFHQRYIDIKNVKLGIEAAISLGIDRIWVDSYYLKSLDSDNMFDKLTKKSLKEVQGMEEVEYSLYQVDFEGRGARSLLGFTEISPEIPNGNCVLPFWLGGDLRSPEVLEIDFEGNVTLCPGICIGNTKEKPLSEIIRNYTYTDYPIIHVLVEEGPIGLHRLAKQHGLKPSTTFVNECHLCYEMRRFLHEHYPNTLIPKRCYQ